MGRKAITDQILVRMIIEIAAEYNIQNNQIVDFCAAYDSVVYLIPLKISRHLGIASKKVRLVRMTMKAIQCSVRVSGYTFEFLSCPKDSD